MTDLASWLLEQIADDEEWVRHLPAASRLFDAVVTGALSPNDSRAVQHFDPARVLAECAAKRRIVEEWQADYPGGYGDGLWHAMACLALPYADRPGYREEWRP